MANNGNTIYGVSVIESKEVLLLLLCLCIVFSVIFNLGIQFKWVLMMLRVKYSFYWNCKCDTCKGRKIKFYQSYFCEDVVFNVFRNEMNSWVQLLPKPLQGTMLQQHMASTGRILKTYTNMAQKIPSNFTCDLWSKSLPFAPILSEVHHILDSITFYQVIHGVRSFDMSKLIFRIFLRCELRNCIWYQILENYPIAETQWRKFFVWVFTSNP